jgi:hypothetical protein
LLPPALERDDRAFFRDLAVPGAALFAITIVAYALTIDWTGAIPRDGTTLAVGRDFLNFWMYGRAASSSPRHGGRSATGGFGFRSHFRRQRCFA